MKQYGKHDNCETIHTYQSKIKLSYNQCLVNRNSYKIWQNKGTHIND